jgi:hypothetical protein
MELLFTPLRNLSDEEYLLVQAAQQRPETKGYTMITVAQADKVKKQPVAVAEEPRVVARTEEPEDDEVSPPTKRVVKKVEPAPKPKQNLADVVNAWGDGE